MCSTFVPVPILINLSSAFSQFLTIKFVIEKIARAYKKSNQKNRVIILTSATVLDNYIWTIFSVWYRVRILIKIHSPIVTTERARYDLRSDRVQGIAADIFKSDLEPEITVVNLPDRLGVLELVPTAVRERDTGFFTLYLRNCVLRIHSRSPTNSHFLLFPFISFYFLLFPFISFYFL